MINRKADGLDNIIKLDQNENPYGASPLALKAVSELTCFIHRYPKFHPEELTAKLAKKYGLPPENIVVAAGSVEIVDMIIKGLSRHRDNIIAPELTFTAYRILSEIHGREARLSAMNNFSIDLEETLRLIDERTKVIFLINPNNPTGGFITHNALVDFLRAVPPRIFIAIDEAYVEYADNGEFPDSIGLLDKFHNLILLRTFSKIYGLAALRIGYGMSRNIGVVKALRENKLHFSVNSFAQAAALAALDDEEFVRQCARINSEERRFLLAKLTEMGFRVLPSQANFLYICFDSVEEKEKVYSHLFEKGIQIRKIDMFGDDKALRISVGRSEDVRRVVGRLGELQ